MPLLRSSLSGTCISFTLGGSITTETGNPLIVFYIAAAILVATFIYVISVLPESFPEEKRNALSLMRTESSGERDSTTSLLVFEPLKMIMPTRNSDGTRNWRFAWCAIHIFVFVIANSYSSRAWLVLATSKYHLSPADVSISIKPSHCKLIFLTQDRYFLHHYHHQRNDYLGADSSGTRPLFASLLQSKNHTFPSRGKRYQQRGRTGIGDL